MRGFRKLNDCVVVITGASSGIGRATARAFAEQGAIVVLAARRESALRELEKECATAGARALVVPTDVRDEEQVRALADRAIENFGRIDVWVNNAAVTQFARFEEAPPDVYNQVIATNLFGYIHGARAVLPRFREQGRGVLINVSSIVAYVSQPYTSAYTISKAGIRALSDSLYEELLDEPHINVSCVLPATIDTPLFQHGSNYTGRAPAAMPPVYPAEEVADAIVQMARSPRRQVFVGKAGRMLAFQHSVAPSLTQRLMARMVDRKHLRDTPASPTPGNVLEPMSEWTGVSGGWRTDASGRGEDSGMGKAVAASLAIGAMAAYVLLRSRSGRRRGSLLAPLRSQPTVGERIRAHLAAPGAVFRDRRRHTWADRLRGGSSGLAARLRERSSSLVPGSRTDDSLVERLRERVRH
jgi:NAD(P)-dependent dehydrogenase (short-subunit alcohol dehydrogenase family)